MAERAQLAMTGTPTSSPPNRQNEDSPRPPSPFPVVTNRGRTARSLGSRCQTFAKSQARIAKECLVGRRTVHGRIRIGVAAAPIAMSNCTAAPGTARASQRNGGPFHSALEGRRQQPLRSHAGVRRMQWPDRRHRSPRHGSNGCSLALRGSEAVSHRSNADRSGEGGEAQLGAEFPPADGQRQRGVACLSSCGLVDLNVHSGW